MNHYDTVFFDLDGTLTDPGEGITNSVAYALEKFGIEVADRSELYEFIGPPLIPTFMKRYGFSLEEARRGVELYREYFTDRGMFENRVYDGVKEMLRTLSEQGLKLAVATSKPEVFAIKIAERFGLAEYFDLIAGATLDESRTAKDQVIAYALEKIGKPDGKGVIMVGDREYDVKGAAKFDIPTIGVLYGYGSAEELTTAGAAALAKTPDEVTAKIKELSDK